MFQLKKVADGKVKVLGLGMHKTAFDLSKIDWKAVAPWLVGGGLGLGTYALSGLVDPEGKYRGRRALMAALAGIGGGVGYHALDKYIGEKDTALKQLSNAAVQQTKNLYKTKQELEKAKKFGLEADAELGSAQERVRNLEAEKDELNDRLATYARTNREANLHTDVRNRIALMIQRDKAAKEMAGTKAAYAKAMKDLKSSHATVVNALSAKLEEARANASYNEAERARYAEELAAATNAGYKTPEELKRLENEGAKRGVAAAQKAQRMKEMRRAGLFRDRDDLEASASDQFGAAVGEHIETAGRRVAETGRAIQEKKRKAQRSFGETLINWGKSLAQ